MPNDPTILGPAAYSRLQTTAPVLRIDLGAPQFFAVEIAADPKLFDPANAALRTPDNFFASWQNGLTGPVDTTTYAIPQNAWLALRKKEALFYRVVTSASGDGWTKPAASTSSQSWQTAPRIVLTNDAPVPAVRLARPDR